MTTQQQNKNWAHLPSDLRRDIKDRHNGFCQNKIDQSKPHALGARLLLEDLFGRDNLTSETEPPEMLCVERKKVQDMRSYNLDVLRHDPTHKGAILLEQSLKRLFGSKCLPDKELNEDNFAKSDKEEQAKPKFKIGDKVRVKEYTINTNNSDSLAFLSGTVFTIKYVGADGYGKFVYTVMEMASPIYESYLEPYTEEKKPERKRKNPQDLSLSDNANNDSAYNLWNELSDESKVHIVSEWLHGVGGYKDFKEEYFPDHPEYAQHEQYWIGWLEAMINTFPEDAMREYAIAHKYDEDFVDYYEIIDNLDNKETMEEKELNLVELLKGCEGESFYHLMCGEVRFMTINADGFVMFDYPENISLYDNGKYDLNAEVVIFPSRALYEKYPLDAKKAWQEWAESRKPKRWRAEYEKPYWYITDDIDVREKIDKQEHFDYARWEEGNYFRTEEEVQQAIEEVRKCLDSFHNRKEATNG